VGYGIFYIFAVVLVACCVFVVWVVPETKGRSVDEVVACYSAVVDDDHEC
jgi:Na+/glutamate symporter